ncbi:MAG: flagellar hook capping protein [Candidatus Cloacimonadota bacterium]|nr:MAG: flagellar hook capping protein [Candidatus Cloacimonadota bacterium]PIE77499.1 MAG: flagellar hook capping protein [Candidatus Delongbacteria bacterium]
MQVVPVGSTVTEQAKQNRSLTDKDSFLQMFVTQVKYQDPLNPMENSEFTAQMAQFTQLEELQNMNTSLDKSIETNLIISQSINNSMATTMIGRDVKTSGSEFNFNGEATTLNYNLGSDSAKVTIDIYDKSGNLVYSTDLTNQSEGNGKFEWDGYLSDGSFAGEGKYDFKITAFDNKNEPIKANTFNVYRITGVKYENGSAILMTDENIDILMGDVLEILDPGV